MCVEGAGEGIVWQRWTGWRRGSRLTHNKSPLPPEATRQQRREGGSMGEDEK